MEGGGEAEEGGKMRVNRWLGNGEGIEERHELSITRVRVTVRDS